ncbi:PREDICTED: killer cell lectin-like receptor subfamily G member 2 [Tauraco erythrolophus]|uniref:killer cell lectin-like receptor subfamily G member 2 n=1 Tax=Tauraco erythrolophus TaxID=121530 RepID=UPI000523461A|nr:PREDICTED: killer cell lectin-like receptor subfamily G member 2 [Tauraco erythrolophus]
MPRAVPGAVGSGTCAAPPGSEPGAHRARGLSAAGESGPPLGRPPGAPRPLRRWHVVSRSSAKDFPICPSLELCPSGWLYFQRKCYYLSESEANWNSSQSLCSLHNASLLVIENHQELD